MHGRSSSLSIEANSYGDEKLEQKWPKSFFFFQLFNFGTKNMIRVNLMATVLFWHGFDN